MRLSSLKKRSSSLKTKQVRGAFTLLEAIFCLFLTSMALLLFASYVQKPKYFSKTLFFSSPLEQYHELQREDIFLRSGVLVFDAQRVVIESKNEQFILLENIR